LVVEEFQDRIRHCQLFRDITFVNRLTYIAEEGEQDFGKTKTMEMYSSDVKLKAGRLLDLIRGQ
jgi:restriction endonuclease